MTRDVHLFISVCSGRGWASRFGHSLASLTMELGNKGLGGRLARVGLNCAAQASVVVGRQSHLELAQREGFTHFLSLDDDMTFPPNTVERLLAHDKDVVTCNYRKKTDEKVLFVCTDVEDQPLSSEGRTGLERVSLMGMGVTFIKLACLQPIPRPYFAVVWNQQTEKFLIEDNIFSGLLAQHGVEIWCDHDLSQSVGHVGEKEYRVPQAYTQIALTPARELVDA